GVAVHERRRYERDPTVTSSQRPPASLPGRTCAATNTLQVSNCPHQPRAHSAIYYVVHAGSGTSRARWRTSKTSSGTAEIHVYVALGRDTDFPDTPLYQEQEPLSHPDHLPDTGSDGSRGPNTMRCRMRARRRRAMLRSVSAIRGFTIHATDGDMGAVDEFLFDDEQWTIRYLVVNTGGWLTGRLVLISPIALRTVDWKARTLDIALTSEQIEHSPDI